MVDIWLEALTFEISILSPPMSWRLNIDTYPKIKTQHQKRKIEKKPRNLLNKTIMTKTSVAIRDQTSIRKILLKFT